jgi:hypothetical protein
VEEYVVVVKEHELYCNNEWVGRNLNYCSH